MKEGNYKGLPNIGATCYINSFIQTLFMTPEFRDGIFAWTYNSKIHPKPQDSILYQLQKLFAKLYLKSSDVSVKDLVKSFQWQDQQAFDQQDIQQFNRVLFEALQKSFGANKKQNSSQLIKQLYQGELTHYTKCLQCLNESSREQVFQDLILVIKNIYEKIYSGSLELSLQRYVKPQYLDENNLYFCESCNKKVRAERGVRFVKLPKFLNVVLQRFHFDYFTQSRNKINDKYTFPHILNFNHYFNGYEQIPNRLNEDSSQYFIKEQANSFKNAVKPKPVTYKKKIVSKVGTTSTQPAVAGKTKTKPSSSTKTFLQQMRKKKMNQELHQNEDLIYVSGTAQQATTPQNQKIQSKQTQQVNISLSTAEDSKNSETKVHEQKEEPFSKVEQVNNKKIENSQKQISNGIPPPPPPLTLKPPTLGDPFDKQSIQSNPNQTINITLNEELSNKMLLKQTLEMEKDQKLKELQKINRQSITMALKDGPLVYQLYSILVHSGTSNAGHYFSYVKSYQNGKWYVFNDERVDEINVTQIEKTFGGSGLSNAYVLYYRIVEQNTYQCEVSVPEYLKRVIQQQEEAYENRKKTKQIDLLNTLILKIYFQLGVKTVQIMKNSPLDLLFRKAKEAFNIQTISEGQKTEAFSTQQCTFIKQQNIRIRLFNPANQIKLDTYKGLWKQQYAISWSDTVVNIFLYLCFNPEFFIFSTWVFSSFIFQSIQYI